MNELNLDHCLNDRLVKVTFHNVDFTIYYNDKKMIPTITLWLGKCDLLSDEHNYLKILQKKKRCLQRK